MKLVRKRTPKAKMFVHAPFIKCPDCETDATFGVLMIGGHQYVRRCIECWYDQHFALPSLRKRIPKAGMYNDIDVVTAYLPFCDAMFVDKEISQLASQGELKTELNGGSRIYSLRKAEKEAFLDFLQSIEDSASNGHIQLVEEIYGKEWANPYTDLLAD